jgi:hypothetical protein
MAILSKKNKTARQRPIKPELKNPESILNDAPRSFTDADFPVGTVAHQGDLILVRIECLPKSAKPRADRQMAIGNTQGSRHMLDKGRPYDCDAHQVIAAIAAVCRGVDIGEQYIGPVFQCDEGEADLLHPEHGDHLYRGDMVIAVVYQRNLDAEEREQRVAD